jgi:Protein of unknown function (DUF2600)
MSAFGDHWLTARMSWALVLANIRYWWSIAPLVRTQIKRWERQAEKISDPMLHAVALENLRDEGFNAQASATLATLAPAEHRHSVVEAIVGLQIIYDYLDSLVERTLPSPLSDGRRLYCALVDAVVLDANPVGNYYAHTPGSDDSHYLEDLVGVVRSALARLPGATAVADATRCAAQRCAEAQARAHAVAALGSEQLTQWARANADGTGLQWREFLAGAVSSGFALHALIAAAADPDVSPKDARVTDEVYLPICALTTLLDGVIDYEQDIHSMGHPGYIRYYDDHAALTSGLSATIERAVSSARDAPNGAYHLMTLVGVVAYYCSAPTASHASAQPITEQIRCGLKPLITPALAVMHSWRAAKRARMLLALVIPKH